MCSSLIGFICFIYLFIILVLYTPRNLSLARVTKFFLMFSSRSFRILGFIFISVFHFEITFAYGVVCLFCICISNCPSSIFWKTKLFFAYSMTFVKNQMSMNVRVYFWKFCGSDSAKIEETQFVYLSHWLQLKTLNRIIHKVTIWDFEE